MTTKFSIVLLVSLLFVTLIMIGSSIFFMVHGQPQWIQHSEPLAGEGSPAFDDVINRPAKAIWQTFQIEHHDDGTHNFSGGLSLPGDTPLFLRNNGGKLENSTDNVTWESVAATEPDPAQDVSLGLELTGVSYYGMSALVQADGTANPLLINVPNDGYWKSATPKTVTMALTYFDEGTEDLSLSLDTPAGIVAKTISRTNSLKWLGYTLNFNPVDTLLLIHSDHADGTALSDSSVYNLTITGGATHNISDAYLGSSSIYCNGSTRIQTTGDINIDTLDGYITFFIKLLDVSGNRVLVTDLDDKTRLQSVSSVLNLVDNGVNIPTSHSFVANTWYHVAFENQPGISTKVWVDGSLVYSGGGLTSPPGVSNTLDFGNSLVGYYDEILIQRYGRLPDSFTPPTAPYELIDSVILNGAMDGADIKIESANNSPLAIQKMTITSENNAQITMNAADF